MNLSRPYYYTFLALTVVSIFGACTPTIETRGNLLSTTRRAEITPHTSTRADVSAKWGPPTTVSSLDPNTWYYIGETTSQKGIYAPDVTKRQIIRVTFDATDTVADVVEIDPKLARNINPSDRKTPTAGKEYTAVQQFVGNLGKFNTEKSRQ